MLEYGKPLSKDDRNEDGAYIAYGANGVKCRTNRFYFDRPIIIVGRKGSAGEVALTHGPFWPLDVTYFVTFDSGKYDLMFLYHCLKQLNLPRLATGVKPGINRNSVYDLQFHFPSLPEQKRIVAILDEAFEGIGHAAANAEKNVANARELFESYLNAVFTQKDAGCVERTLEDICIEFGRGKSKHRPRNDSSLYGGMYPFVQTGDISNARHVVRDYTQTYNEIGLAQSKLWPKGTICLAIVGATIGETGVLDFDACFPDSVIGMIVDPCKADSYCIDYLLQHFKKQNKEKGKGSARHNINLGTFKDHKFPIPPVSVQREVACRLDLLFKEAERLQSIYLQKRDALTKLKQSILQKAFSGELTAQPNQTLKEAVA